jgi:predicted membrane protein
VLTNLDLQLGAGAATVDLTGDWQQDLDATIQAGVGNLVLRFPSDVGVRVDIEGGIQNVNTSGMNQDRGSYVNSTYGESAVSIRLDIEAGIGNIELRVIE